MDVYKIKALSAEERHTLLLGESVECNEEAYMKSLSDQELSVKRERIVQVSLLKSVLEDEFSDIKENYKLKINPLKEEFGMLLSELRVKMVEVTGKVYKLADFDHQMMHFVTDDGSVLSSRPMLPEERQHRIPLSQQHSLTLKNNGTTDSI